MCRRDPDSLNAHTVDEDAEREVARLTHKTVRRVGEDLERFKFNTALAALMEYTNALNRHWEQRSVSSDNWRDATEKLILMLAPMAPHVAEELWEQTGRAYSVHRQAWPDWDPDLAADEVVTLVVQVNGRVRDKIEVSADVTEDRARQLALSSRRVQAHVEGKEIARLVYVPGRLVNVVVR